MNFWSLSYMSYMTTNCLIACQLFCSIASIICCTCVLEKLSAIFSKICVSANGFLGDPTGSKIRADNCCPFVKVNDTSLDKFAASWVS